MKKVGLSLSGGAARAAVHIGVIKALYENGITIAKVTGTSGGAIIGALLAKGLGTERMIDFVEEGSLWKMYRPNLPIQGFTKLDYLSELLQKYGVNDDFESLKIPFSIATTNLRTGKVEYMSSGSLHQSVMASSAIPMMFNPIRIGDDDYADGGILDNMPVDPLIDDCEFIIGVNVIPNLPVLRSDLNSLIRIGMRVFHLIVAKNAQNNFPHCDILIEPEGITDYGLFDFKHARVLTELGYQNTIRQMDAILCGVGQG